MTTPIPSPDASEPAVSQSVGAVGPGQAIPATLPAGGLRQAAVRGVLLTVLVAIVSELIGVFTILVVARFIQPRDYALLGIAWFALALGLVVRDLRISQRLVQLPGDPAAAFDAGFTLELRLGVAYLLFALPVAPLVARIYGQPGVVPVLMTMSLVGFYPALMLPVAQLQRDLIWWRQRVIDAVGPAVGAGVTLGMAVAHLGVWALVAGQLSGWLAQGVVLWVRAPRRPRLLRRLPPGSLRMFLSFGVPLWISGIVAIVALNAIVFVIVATLGFASLGFFRVAGAVGERIDRAEQAITPVIYPVLCRLTDPAAVRRAFTLSNKLILLWAAPVGAGLAVFAPEITHVILGHTWETAPPGSAIGSVVPLLRVEGIGEVLNAIATTWVVFYQASGTTRPVVAVSIITFGSMLAAVAVLCPLFGYGGVVAALAITAVVGVLLRRHRMRRLLAGVPVILPVARLLLSALLAGAIAMWSARWLGGFRLTHVAGRVALFLAVYALLVFIVERPLIRDTVNLVRGRDTPLTSLGDAVG